MKTEEIEKQHGKKPFGVEWGLKNLPHNPENQKLVAVLIDRCFIDLQQIDERIKEGIQGTFYVGGLADQDDWYLIFQGNLSMSDFYMVYIYSIKNKTIAGKFNGRFF